MPSERFRDVGEISLDIHDLEGLRVDGVELVSRIETRERGDGGTDEGHGKGFAVVDGEGVADSSVETGGEVVVEDLELVLVGVAEEDARDGVGGVAADDAVEERGGVGEVVGAVVAGEHVADDPGALVPLLALVELGDEEAEDAGLVRVGEVEIVEDVVGIPEVGVEGDDAQALGGGVGIGAVMSRGIICFIARDPSVLLPHGGQEVVVPAEDVGISGIITVDIIGCVVCFWEGIMVS